MNYLLLDKPIGLSPQQAITLLRQQRPQLQHIKLGTVGRLDPMAEGLLVIMVGDENKHQGRYINLDKVYETEFILGVKSDSYDLLGIPYSLKSSTPHLKPEELESVLDSLTGDITQKYPPFSAVRVKGKPLYWWTRQNRLDEIEVPSSKRLIYSIDLLENSHAISKEYFLQTIQNRISKVSGDFRQANILDAWRNLLTTHKAPENFFKFKLRISCSSGTFVRGLIHQIGLDLRCGAVTYSITRTKVGQWELSEAMQLNCNQ